VTNYEGGHTNRKIIPIILVTPRVDKKIVNILCTYVMKINCTQIRDRLLMKSSISDKINNTMQINRLFMLFYV